MEVTFQPDHPITNEACLAATGKTMDELYAAMDAFGGPSKGRRELGRRLNGDLNVDVWWVQTLNPEYEVRHGLKEKDGRPKGHFICSTKTVAAPIATVYQAWTDPELLGQWFGAGTAVDLREGGAFSNPDGNRGTYRRIRENKDLRFEWHGETGDESLVDVQLTDKGEGKTGILVNHDRIQSRAEADGLRRAWSESLARLKTLLEGAA